MKKAKKQKQTMLEVEKPREGSKKTVILEMLKRPAGATLQDLMSATGWQPHSVRGFLSAAVSKKLGLPLSSEKQDDGQRLYRIS